MATLTPRTPMNQLGRGGDRPAPPSGGGDDGGFPDSVPNYGVRLRRARLGLVCAIATVSMVFVSLTSAYVVRRGLPTFDDLTRTYFRDWGTCSCPGCCCSSTPQSFCSAV